MAAPEFVPLKPTDDPRSYKSPPRRPEPWLATRPGEVVDKGQPTDDRLGRPGPDQGYALVLARRFEGRLTLTPLEHEADALAGAVVVALKRAAVFGRAPVVHDLTIALTIWGYLDESPAAELVALRHLLFEEVRNPHHYREQRAIADAVPDATLRLTPDAVAEAHRSDWRSLVAV